MAGDIVWDMNIRLGDVLVMVSFAAGALLYVFRAGGWKRDIDDMKVDMGEMKESQKQVAKLLTDVAVQNMRLNALQEQISMQMRWIDDLRRGRGFIVAPTGAPLSE